MGIYFASDIKCGLPNSPRSLMVLNNIGVAMFVVTCASQLHCLVEIWYL